MDSFVQEEWFSYFAEECKATIVEAVKISRTALIEGRHHLGEAIELELRRRPINKTQLFQALEKTISIKNTTFSTAHRFYLKFPDLSKLPEGDMITYNQIVTKYLSPPEETHEHAYIEETWLVCKCGARKRLDKDV